LWCKTCNKEIDNDICDACGNTTEVDTPTEIYWCKSCNVPIVKDVNSVDKNLCSLCGEPTTYLSVDLRPVFPEERLLMEIISSRPQVFIESSVWASDSRYYIDGKTKTVSSKFYEKYSSDVLRDKINEHRVSNSYKFYAEHIKRFVRANQDRLNYLKDEAFTFIQSTAAKYPPESVVVSFSGGKDSTVTADLAVRALSNPSLVHIFGDTTLEFPLTIEYTNRFRELNPKAIFKVAKNKEQNFHEVCEDIGPPARMLRWCCFMFKTGPINRTLNSLYRDKDILTFYGIRKCESVSRSKYNRVEDNAESVKINNQTVASPIFYWKDIDIWLYMLAEKIDFNDAYRLGYDRVGCWCCPNNNTRAQFLSQIYMPEQSEKWRSFLIGFAKRIGKPDPEIYVDSGKWKARQGGNGVASADDVKIKYTNCTAEDHAKIYQLNKPISEGFYELFIPFGRIAPELGKKLINETIVVDKRSNVPILSIQPFAHDGYNYSVKIKTMNVAKHDDLQRMASYQIRKFNACRKCLKCESLCKFGAISIHGDIYHISDAKCKRCKMCVTSKYLDGGCLMDKYLKTKELS